MRKNILAISLIVSFLMVVIHEMIPHHHHGMDDDIELFSHQQHNSNQNNNSETGNANHFPFPAHHHVSASEGFDIVRLGTGLERNFNFSVSSCFLIPQYLSWFPEAEPPENTFYTVITVPKSSHPFIISPNAMRGSPSVA
ncbi:MAG: hypothetical protein Q8N05_20980 [Bacteroidota bacterium]|nr:hypothetical protein [Bacteroidota bacterium]